MYEIRPAHDTDFDQVVALLQRLQDVPAEHPAADRIWDRTADALYDTARAAPALRDISDSELFGHVEHRRLAGFARRHGFPSGRYTSVLAVDGVDLVRLIGTVPDRPDAVDVHEFPTPPTDSVAAAAVIRLHDACFPSTYLSAAQVLAGGTDRTVIVAFDAGRLVGYAVGRAQPAEYSVDFVAVAAESRGRGIAGALLTVLIQRLADRHGAR